MKIVPDKRQLLLQVLGFDFELCCSGFFKQNQKQVIFSGIFLLAYAFLGLRFIFQKQIRFFG